MLRNNKNNRKSEATPIPGGFNNARFVAQRMEIMELAFAQNPKEAEVMATRAFHGYTEMLREQEAEGVPHDSALTQGTALHARMFGALSSGSLGRHFSADIVKELKDKIKALEVQRLSASKARDAKLADEIRSLKDSLKLLG